MKHRETRLCGPELRSGHFFCPAAGPLTLRALASPPTSQLELRSSPQRGEGEAAL
jgi:hypothetical protein